MKRFLIMLCAVALLSVSAMLGVSADLQADADFDCAYSWGPADGVYRRFGSSSVTRLTAAEATAAGIPSGYRGDVLCVENNTDTSRDILIDFSAYRIPTALVKSITFRVYVGEDGTAGDDYPEVRIRQKGDRWVMRYDIHKKLAQWVDITIDNEGKNFESGRSMEDLSVDGYLDKAGLEFRCNVANVPFYIDSITCEMTENTTAPVLNYEGASTVLAHEGAQLVLNVTATDPEEGKVEVKYEWSDPNAQNADGTLNRGEYTLKIYAEDYFGNRAEMTLPVSVGDGDNEAPVITVADEIRAVVGARPSLKPTATDNSGYAKVEGQWSAGAIDRYGRLTVGVHTYTVTATDASGNYTVKAITVRVSSIEDWGDNLIDEANPPQPEPTPTPTPPGGGENDGNNDNNNNDNNNSGDNNNNNDNNDNNDNGNGGSESDEPPVQDEGNEEETEADDRAPATDIDGGDLYVGIAIGIGCGALIASLIFGVILAIRSREKRDW